MPWHGAQEAGVGEDELGREVAVADETLRAVEIGEDGVEQRGALDDRSLDVRPLARRR